MSTKDVGNERLLKIDEVSRLTGLTIGTLRHYCSENRIPVVRLSKRCVRFRLSALLRWFDELESAETAHTNKINGTGSKQSSTRNLTNRWSIR